MLMMGQNPALQASRVSVRMRKLPRIEKRLYMSIS
jgi:hypothetical protein